MNHGINLHDSPYPVLHKKHLEIPELMGVLSSDDSWKIRAAAAVIGDKAAAFHDRKKCACHLTGDSRRRYEEMTP